MLSTKFKEQLFLGFKEKQVLKQPTIEDTFIGGCPVYLRQPALELLHCDQCQKQPLTFLMQLFCPLAADRSYNRILYIMFCDVTYHLTQKCKRCFRCLKQQTPQHAQPPKDATLATVRTIMPNSFSVDSDSLQVKQLMKIINKCRLTVEEDTIDEIDDDDEEDQEQANEQTHNYEQNDKLSLVNAEMAALEVDIASQIEQNQAIQQKTAKDVVFQQYRKIMTSLDNPILIYGNIPLPYNSFPINPQHSCTHCSAKLALELQLTSQMLMADERLYQMDWGSILVFTCSDSCDQSVEECTVVQFEVDVVKEDQIKMLNKIKKNRNRRNKKKNDKSEQQGEKNQNKPSSESGEAEGQGDWD